MKPIALCSILLLAACGGSSEEEGGEPNANTGALEPYYSADPLTGAVEVSQLRSLGDGADVVVRGDVQDFIGGVAAFNLYDSALMSCDEMPEPDHCTTPWDYCCEDDAKIAVGSALVEFRDGGELIAAGLSGFHGIDHLTDVVVAGKLKLDESGNVTVVASKIHVE